MTYAERGVTYARCSVGRGGVARCCTVGIPTPIRVPEQRRAVFSEHLGASRTVSGPSGRLLSGQELTELTEHGLPSRGAAP